MKKLAVAIIYFALMLSTYGHDDGSIDTFSNNYCYITFVFDDRFEGDDISLKFGDNLVFRSKLISPRNLALAAKVIIFIPKPNGKVLIRASLEALKKEKTFEFDYTKGSFVIISKVESGDLYIRQVEKMQPLL